jgi:hypothetical protein
VTPTLIRTKKGAKRRFQPIRRQCYFEEEISLNHCPVEDSYRDRVCKTYRIKISTFVWFVCIKNQNRTAKITCSNFGTTLVKKPLNTCEERVVKFIAIY